MVRLTDMRGDERVQDGMFSYVSLEQRVPQDHPLRAVRKWPARPFLYQLGTIKLVMRGVFDGTREEAYG